MKRNDRGVMFLEDGDIVNVSDLGTDDVLDKRTDIVGPFVHQWEPVDRSDGQSLRDTGYRRAVRICDTGEPHRVRAGHSLYFDLERMV